jgi:hypothetical protein
MMEHRKHLANLQEKAGNSRREAASPAAFKTHEEPLQTNKSETGVSPAAWKAGTPHQ